jgi:phosphoglycerol transferase MdoB-like AlkP superfamily enzyme
MLKSFTGPIYPFLKIFLLALAVLTVARTCHVVIFFQHVESFGQIVHIFLQGLRIDIMLISTLFILPVIIFTVMHTLFGSNIRKTKKILTFWSVITVVSMVFFELITPWYMSEYGARPERKFFEYLDNPREVMMMLWGMYGFLIFGIAIITSISAVAMHRMTTGFIVTASRWSTGKLILALPLVVLLMMISIRSSLDHRPLNPSTVAFTDNTVANALPLNSLYSVLYAIYRMKDESSASEIYGNLSKSIIENRVYQEKIKHNPYSLQATNNSKSTTAARNLVIILEESLGARFVSKLGGAALTPNLDELALEGWWFTNLYATGTRSVRGIEAVVTGFLPTPARSIVKLPNSQSGFFTLASHLRPFGYYSRFYYGGNAQFDNMKGFFLGNGFHEVIEQSDFVESSFLGSWGASDQDVFNRIHEDLKKSGTKPLLSVVLTTSNHTPFDFPTNVNAKFEVPLKSRENAIRYADAALGDFIAKAKKAPYWKNTIFLIIADHDQRVADFVNPDNAEKASGRKIYFPTEGFHIPGLILGDSIQPLQTNNIISQIDLPPTLLALLGVNAPQPMLGTDLTQIDQHYSGRAIMQYNNLMAYLDGDSMAVLRPGMAPLTGHYQDNQFIPMSSKKLDDLGEIALAHALWANISYQEGSYH